MREIPLVDLKAGFEPIKAEIMKAIEDVLQGMNLNMGPNCQNFEKEFAEYCGVRHALGVGSGTEALQFALLACGVTHGDEVIMPPHTFFATAEAALCIGARPVFADIDPSTYTINSEPIRKCITKRTKAIIAVHMYGQAAEMEPLREISSEYGIPLVEDACQAHGAYYYDKKSGSLGAAGCFSFYFTKNLGAYGEGGIVTTGDDEIAEKVRLYRNHGHRSKYEHAVAGFNGRLDEVQAAILRIKLKHLDTYNQKRRERALLYNSLLKDTPLLLPVEAENRKHVYHLYVVQSSDRDSLQEYLKQKGIGTGIHYKTPVHLQEAVVHLGYKSGDFPGAEEACGKILSLPIYPELNEDDQIYITDKIKEFYDR